MSLGSSVNGTESQGAERSAAALLAALRERLAAYDELDRECTRLAQEEKTLETYVRNLMDSNVRAKKTVSYYEEAVGNSDSSDFELSDAEEAPKKSKKPAGAAKRGRPPKAAAAKAESEAEQTEEPTHTDASADGDGGSEKRPAKRPAPPDSESDAYCSEKDEEPSSGDESDFGGATVVVDVTPRKKQATAKAKGAAASAAAAVSKPGPKKSAAGKQGAAAPRPLLSPPRAPAAGRPRLTSSGSSGSLSLSLGSPARSPGGVKRRAGGASLKDLLRGSNVPRAGLSRRVSLKRTGS